MKKGVRNIIGSKGQTTVAVAVLIIAMLIFVIIYLLSLPPEDRNELLNITTDDGFTGDIVRITVEVDEFFFDPDVITVDKGDKVIVTLENEGQIPHNWGIPEFGVRTDTIEPGEEDTVTFIANKKGTFTFYCSVTGHRGAGEYGELEVE